MRLSRVAGIAVVPLLGCTLVAGCGQTFRVATPQGTATCKVANNGQGGACSVNGHTVSVEPGAGSAPATHRTPVPTGGSPVTTATPTPTVPTASPVVATPQSTFDANAISAVQQCMSQFPTDPKDTLVSFSTSADARSNMAVCLQMPPQTVALFLHLLFKYAYAAYVHGDFDSQAGQDNFTSTMQGDTLPRAVIKCDRHYT
jgi:hypothetical protein